MINPDYSYEINIHPCSDKVIVVSCDAMSLKNTVLRLADLTGGNVAEKRWQHKDCEYILYKYEPFSEQRFYFECDIEYLSANHAEFAMYHINKKLHKMSELEKLLELECKKK